MHERRFTDLLTAAVVATYVLVALGATVATTGSDCGAWPFCGDPFTADGVVTIAHRGAALLGGVLVAVSAVAARRVAARARVRRSLDVAVLAYAGQIALGAAVAAGGSADLAGLHLAAGVGIFGVLVYALVLALEAGVETESGSAVSNAAEAALEIGDGSRTAKPLDDSRRVDDSTGESVRTDDAARERGPAGDRDPIAVARAYVTLTKPRLMWLLCLLAVAGMALSALSGSPPTGVAVVATLAGGVLAIGASGVANHVFERNRDRRMRRTADRPLARDLVSVRGAIAFCAILTVGALAIPWLLVSGLVAALIGIAIVYYAVVYTVVLKPNTRWSTLIGGGSGALPAVIGWAAAAGSIDPPALALAGIVILWTPAHFYNLALAYREDYALGGFPLVPVVEGPATARRRIVGYLAATLVAASALGAFAGLGALYVVATAFAGGAFLYAVVLLYRERTDAAALRAFYASNAYLGLVLLAIVVEAAALA